MSEYKFRYGAYLDAPRELAMMQSGDMVTLRDVRLTPSGTNVQTVTARISLKASVVSRHETETTFHVSTVERRTNRIAKIDLEVTDVLSADLRRVDDAEFAAATDAQMAELRASLVGRRRHYVATHVDDLEV